MNRKANYIVLSVFFLLYAASWLPYFGFVNELTYIGPFPLPMAWGIGINVVNTVIMIVVYFKFFKPYGRRMEGFGEENVQSDTEQEAQF